MEFLVIIAVIVVIGALIYFNKDSKGLDVNKDGKVDATDAKAAVQNVVVGVKAKADVNKDGKVTVADAKVAATKAKTAVKKAAVKAKTAGRSARAKK
jgi:hypothetical protein